MNTFSIHFYLKKEKARQNGEAPIYARITINGRRAELAIKRYIQPQLWDAIRTEAKGRKAVARELNTYMDTIRNKLYQHHRDLLDRGETITAKTLKEAYLGKKKKGKGLVEVYEYHNLKMKELIGKEYSAGTLQRFTTTLKHLKEFMKTQYQLEEIELQELNYRFITDFDHFLRTVKNIGNNTTVKYISLFRKIVRLAIENEWLEKDPFHNYKGKLKTIDREFLDKEELKRLQEKTFHTSRLENVRDIFVFACYTGLAYSDVAKLTPDHLALGVDGNKWINVNRTKTESKSLIPLLPPALAIIEKYKKHPEVVIKGNLLPIKSNQKMNAYLKEIAELCEINKSLTFHMARHTFATTVTLSNGVPIESVSSMLGHKNIKTTQHYAKIVQRKVSDDMQALKGKLFGEEKSEVKIKKIS